MAVVEARAAWRRSAQESTLIEPHHASGHERSPSTRSERACVSVDSARRQACAKYPTLRRVFVGSAHARTCAARLEATHDVTVHVVRHSGGGGRNVGCWQVGQLSLFEPPTRALPRCRRAGSSSEAMLGCGARTARLVMRHDRLASVSESWVWLFEARRLLRGLSEG